MDGEKTSRFLPLAASSPIRTASATSQLRNVTPSAGAASSGWWVSTNVGPLHDPEPLAAAAAALRASWSTVDVTDACSVDRLRLQATEQLDGPPDLLVNCAGVLSVAPIIELEPAEWDRVMAVNARGPFLCSRAFAPAMIRGGSGSIVNVASVSGRRGEAGLAHYCASKFAVIGFTQALACELAPHGVRANAVCPGTVDTAMMRTLAGSAEGVQRFADEQLLPRAIAPAAIGRAVLFLATAGQITAQALNVDGGWAFS